MPLQEQIRAYYRFSDRNFEDDLIYHTLNEDSVIYLSNEHLLLARPVSLSSAFRHIVNPAHHYKTESCDAWHIHLLIGPPDDLVTRLERQFRRFPYVVFQRGGAHRSPELRKYRTDRLFSLLSASTINSNH